MKTSHVCPSFINGKKHSGKLHNYILPQPIFLGKTIFMKNIFKMFFHQLRNNTLLRLSQ